MDAILRRRLLIAASVGAGAVAMGGLILGIVVWRASRPERPIPWNTSALIAQEPPGFGFVSSNDRHLIRFSYVVENRRLTIMSLIPPALN